MPNLFSPGDVNIDNLFDDYYHNHLAFNKVRSTRLIDLGKDKKICMATDTNFTYLKLEERESNIDLSLMRLKEITVSGKKYFLVNKSYSSIQGKGYAIPLYEYSFCYLEYPVISGILQTKPGSSDLWKKLQQRPDKAYEIKILNTNTNNIIPYNSRNFNDYDIWGWDSENIKQYKINPEYILGKGLFDEIEEGDSNELNELFEEDKDEIIIPEMHYLLADYLKKGKNKIKDREHIRIIGQKK